MRSPDGALKALIDRDLLARPALGSILRAYQAPLAGREIHFWQVGEARKIGWWHGITVVLAKGDVILAGTDDSPSAEVNADVPRMIATARESATTGGHAASTPSRPGPQATA